VAKIESDSSVHWATDSISSTLQGKRKSFRNEMKTKTFMIVNGFGW